MDGVSIKKNINTPLLLELFVDGVKTQETIANNERVDIKEESVHTSGMVGFSFDIDNLEVTDKTHFEIKIKDTPYSLDLSDAHTTFVNGFKEIHNFKLDTSTKIDLCILHVGMHKTGTSSLQHNLSTGENKNFSYFDLGYENHSIPLFSMFSVNKYEYHIHKSNQKTKEDVDRINRKTERSFKRHLMQNLHHDTFVISGEDISSLNYDELSSFKNYLTQFFNNIKVVFYIRSPYSYINSSVQQMIQQRETNFHEIITASYPNYRDRVEKFDLLFGEENVQLNCFSKESMTKKDITQDFLKKNHLETNSNNFITKNESLSLEALSFLYVLNKENLNIPNHETYLKLVKILSSIKSFKFMLSNKLISPVVNKNIEDVRWMERRIGHKILDDNKQKSKLLIRNEYDFYTVAVLMQEKLNKLIKKNKNRSEAKSLSKLKRILAL